MKTGNIWTDIFINVVGFFLILIIVDLNRSGYFSKSGRAIIKLSNEIEKLNKKLNDINEVNNSGLLSNKEYQAKKKEVESQILEAKANQLLYSDKRYGMIIKAFKKGVIDENEKNKKIADLKIELTSSK